ncbi:MAG: hypothetical protein ACE14V_07745 [bacterium]
MRLIKRFSLIFFSAVLAISVSYATEYQSQVIATISWGLGSEEIGLQQGQEIETVGPTTFALDNLGNIYLYDFVNKQIKKYDASGKWIANIGTGLVCSSFCIDDAGNVYLLDVDSHIVRVYSAKGELNQEIKIDDSIKLIEGYAQKIYIDAAQNLVVNRVNQQVHPLATISTTGLKSLAPIDQVKGWKNGYLGKADKYQYWMVWENKHRADIIISDGALNFAWGSISIQTKDELGAVLFLGQDTAGNIYAEIERTDAKDILHLEVWKYNSARKLVNTIEIPNDYFSTVYKKLEVDDAGNIYQMQTKPEGVRVIKYSI